MKEISLRTLFTGKSSNSVRIIALFFFIVLLIYAGNKGYAAGVNINPASGGANICSSKAIGGSAPAYTTLGNITVTETANADLSGPATDILVLSAPAGWQFNTAATPGVSYISGSNITGISVATITATSLTINITTNGTNGSDQFTISGLQVQATSASSGNGNIYPSSVVGIAGLTTGTGGTNFGSMSLMSPLTPSVTITASPTGPICPGTNVLFTPNAVNGGTSPAYQWYLNGTGVVTGATYANSSLVNGNTVSCTMTASGSCLTTTIAASNVYTVTVMPGPLPVNGATVTCPGTTISLSDNTTGGTWSSSNTTVATTDASGNVTGAGVGTATISYTAGGCPSTLNITVNDPPTTPVLTTTLTTMCSGDVAAITATGTVLPSTILSQNFNSGISPWTADNTGSIGTLTGSGWKVCGNGYINDQGIYYSPDSSAFAMSNSDTSGSSSYTVSKLTSPVFSLANYSGATLTFQQAYEYWPAGDSIVSLQISTDGGGTWSTLQNYVGANVGNRTGFVTETFSLNAYLGQTNLRLRFYYYCHWGYYWAIDNILISGTSSIVVPVWSPSTYLYTDAGYTTPYITGTALNTVYVHPSSITTAGAITYSATAVSTGCSAASTSTINFNPTPSPITGTGRICVAASINLSDVTTGGTWTSGNPAIATVAPGTGVVTGVSGGTVTISYALSTGCYAATVITVNPLPVAISGASGVCIGATANLTDATTGGSWASSNASVATIGSGTGLVTSVATGTTNITYSLATGCSSFTTVTVNPLPSAINGNATVCVGSLMNLSDPDGGGTWSSGATTIAAVGSNTGTVTGVSAGSATITYTLGTGCSITMQLTVNPLLPITGVTNVCALSSVMLSDGLSGGTWSSNNTTVATAGSSTGLITGVAGGITIITYTLPTGCTATTVFTVNPLPATITGNTEVCAGLNTTLSDAITGGVWSSAATSIATVGSSSGIVHGVSAGTATIKYSLSTGCFITILVTVDPLPQPISGSTNVCIGSATTLSDASGGGTWNSNDVSIATVGSTSGVVNGVSSGTTIITYTLPTGCTSTTNFTVNPLPTPINGSNRVCNGLSISLSDITPSGAWSSSNTSVAAVNAVSGVVTGAGQGTATISYTLVTGCYITTTITVDPLPGPITGNAAVCNGFSTTLSDVPAGGIWSSGATGVATIGSGSGIVAGVSAGTSIITYTLSTGCIALKVATVNPLPGIINGTAAVCVGLTTSLSDATGGGIWSSNNTTVGTIGSTSGVVSGINAGTASITYMLGTGCFAAATVTVSALPTTILGANNVCQGGNISLSDAITGGTWSSSNTIVAGIGSGTGVVTGLATGTANISYTTLAAGGIGCSTAATITVNPLPSGISGASSVCTGASINLTDLTAGGNWSSNNTPVATIGPTGILNGLSVGSATITYVLPTSCAATKTIFVNQTPAIISGGLTVCQGTTAGLSDLYTGGIWTSSNASVAGIGSATGVVSGSSAGTSNITYTLSGGCNTISVVTVNISPANITGTIAICAGSTTNLSNAVTGGTWGSSSTSVATIGSGSGFVNGITTGTTNITYTLSDGCTTDTMLTVNMMPTAINGTFKLCTGTSTTLSDNVTGGVWSSSNTAAAQIGSATGIVNGFSIGTSTITYGFPTGCMVTAVVTVNAVPGSISGTTSICFGFTTTLTDATAGGVWTSSNTSVATIGTGGFVITVSTGVTMISYTLPTGCAVSRGVFVNPQPSMIDGTTNICAGTVTILTDSIGGGTWSSGNMAIATIGSGSGALTGVGSGTAVITYSLGAGCISTTLVTVNLLPSSIAGSRALCAGSTIILSDPTSGGGTWSSSNLSVATIGASSGLVTGISAGTTNITYTIGPGCTLATTITVNPLPSVIVEPANLCYGLTVTLGDTATSGVWSSSNTTIATIGSATGIISGIATGTTIITYSLSTGCKATTTITVYPLPSSISGTRTVCAGLTTALSDITTGGTWVSGFPGIAMIGSATGIVSAIAQGTTTISYILGTGCYTKVIVTVNPLPTPILGNGSVCAGLTISMSDTTSGGTWSSSNTSVATIDVASGMVHGITAGTSNITYALATGCINTTTVTVYPLPAAINGAAGVCPGNTIDLTDATGGGIWSSNDVSIATIDPVSGTLAGVNAGTTTITYTFTGTGCINVTNITVNPLPASISGVANVCIALATALTDDTLGGVWSSSAPLIASVGSASGIASGVAAGTATITYTLPTGCIQTEVITVYSLPSVIMGTKTICDGLSTVLSDSVAGGIWSCVGSPGIVTVAAATGVITAVSVGTTTITYTVSTGCTSTAVVTVNPLPGAINGMEQVCIGQAIGLSDSVIGGTWSGSVITVATVGSGTGIVTGVASGVTDITYTLPTGCIMTKDVTVDALPAPITGIATVCAGSATILSDVFSGGVWSIPGPSGIASIDSFTGIVTGISAGTVMVTYTISTGCVSTTTLTVNPLPLAIGGITNVCVGLTTNLTDVTTGGSWSSMSLLIAGVGSSGVVTGISAGTAMITYTLATGCMATTTITVNPLPVMITGTLNVCVGSGRPLSDASLGGTWSSGSPGIAAIGSGTGIVTGVLAGTAAITYTLGTGCITTTTVTVNPLPAAITGTMNVCAGLTTGLSDAAAGGSWSSSPAGIGSINTAGVVTGISAGTSIITYQLPTGCQVTTNVTVNPLPAIITGTAVVCTGTTTTLSDATTGGHWSVAGTGIASVGSATGTVTGLSGGTAIITYTLPTGCLTTMTETVFTSPLPISGSGAVCVGATINLTDAFSSGTWMSSNASVASVGSTTGIVSGLMAGSTVITYALGTGCFSVAAVIVNPLPVPITGTTTICTGHTAVLSDTTGGGLWSSSAGGIATIGSVSGLVTALATGSVGITYTLATNCYITTSITVNPSPVSITGTTNVCAGLNTILSDLTSGGIWSSSSTTIANVGTGSGVVSGISAGTTTISYILSTGCYAITPYTVNPLPSPIYGNRSVCIGSTSGLSDALTAGTWSIAGSASIATIGTTSGIVSGHALGTVTVIYTLPTGCTTNAVITVNPYPAVITGTSSVCQGAVIYLSDITASGTWSSSNIAIGTVNASGVVSGMSGGSVTISYTLPTGCYVIKPVTVNPIYPIAGSNNICTGATSIYSDFISGGTWSSNNTTVATISPTTGVATAIASGTTIFSYTLGSGCFSRLLVTVNPLPASFYVIGGGSYCPGSSGATIGLNGSDTGIDYYLYKVTSLITSQAGAGTAIYFGPYTTTGTYFIIAVNNVTGCSNKMADSAIINLAPVLVPSVSISTGSGDTVCAGSNVTFTAFPVNGGISPVYQWYLNGTAVTATSNTYHFAPVTGDIISVLLTSDAACVMPDTARGSLTVVTKPNLLPFVTISASPGDTLCAFSTATLIPAPVNGGTLPLYRWIKNGIPAGWGSTYNFSPVNGDNVFCVIHSNYQCLVSDTANSNNINFTVIPPHLPAVTINAIPGINITSGQNDTLIALVTGGGPIVTYQWEINSIAVPGATSDTFIYNNFVNNDTVDCIVTGSDLCGGIPVKTVVVISVSKTSIKQFVMPGNDIALLPNPNNGRFAIKGTTGSTMDEAITIEITDMLGQVIFEKNITANNGTINEEIDLSSSLSNGMYQLHLLQTSPPDSPSAINNTLHFVIRK